MKTDFEQTHGRVIRNILRQNSLMENPVNRTSTQRIVEIYAGYSLEVAAAVVDYVLDDLGLPINSRETGQGWRTNRK